MVGWHHYSGNGGAVSCDNCGGLTVLDSKFMQNVVDPRLCSGCSGSFYASGGAIYIGVNRPSSAFSIRNTAFVDNRVQSGVGPAVYWRDMNVGDVGQIHACQNHDQGSSPWHCSQHFHSPGGSDCTVSQSNIGRCLGNGDAQDMYWEYRIACYQYGFDRVCLIEPLTRITHPQAHAKILSLVRFPIHLPTHRTPELPRRCPTLSGLDA